MKFLFLVLFSVVITAGVSQHCQATETPVIGVGSYRISSSADDAESDELDARFTATSSDLEIPREGSDLQVVGLRFRDVEIPRNALITQSSITFEIDSISRAEIADYDNPIDIIIVAENLGSPRLSFSSSPGREPEDRLANATKKTVSWWTSEFPDVNEKLVTSDLSPVLQELVSDARWDPTGTDVVFMLRQNPLALPEHQGSREVESYNGESSAAPELNFSYQERTLPENFTIPAIPFLVTIFAVILFLALGTRQQARDNRA